MRKKRNQKEKRVRRNGEQMKTVKDAIFKFAQEMRPVSVRQIFYNLTTQNIVDKTKNGYEQVVSISGKMREDGELPFSWISDATRWMRKPDTHDTLIDALEITKETYRKNLWANQSASVEIWLEKEALSGVVFPITARWDVPLMVTRGYPSKTFLYTSAEDLNVDKTNYIYMLSDYDPSGVDLSRNTESTLRKYADEDCDITFERIAVTESQINEWELPSRPTKKSDVRSKTFTGESVELDAIPPDSLRGLVEDSITQHIDESSYLQLCEIESAERESLQAFMGAYANL